ncbi:hypothetical protein ABL78_5627 [Leptomonas seymouri]|uniref:Uncharacterized protein n=1 Tax=Leptomonas seymouri TaxID=5684 RepID=A0A0N1I3A0_LEPSE|nr:hypothetical protein ABL78_5627 [Leptomonas seymouri]|eukprot:KPI85315.1 hypothetical protein ABL78_5627 [Leptomonas seymouri]
MRPLKIKRRTSVTESAKSLQATTASASSSAGPVTDRAVSETPALVPTPPPSRQARGEPSPPSHSDQATPASSGSTTATTTQRTAVARSGVKFSSELDNANVEAYLEYLTHPHTSWGSALRYMAHRREVIESHRTSVFARSLVSSRRSSFASTMRSEGGDDALEMSMTSVASAPAGFPRSASNASKTQTGKLLKGRLGDPNSVPTLSLVATSMGTPSAATPLTSFAAGNENQSRTASSHLSVDTGQRRGSTSKGRLSRGGALAGRGATRVTTSASETTTSVPGPDLTVGGTHLQTGSTNLFVGSVSASAVSRLNASRDGATGCKGARAKMKGN